MDPVGTLKQGTSKARQRIGPLLIVLVILGLLAASAAIKAWNQTRGASEVSAAAFVCPEAPLPFVLRENVFAEVEGEQVYIACAWVGGVPSEPPLP